MTKTMRIQRRGGVVDVDLAMTDLRRWLGLPTEAEIAKAKQAMEAERAATGLVIDDDGHIVPLVRHAS